MSPNTGPEHRIANHDPANVRLAAYLVLQSWSDGKQTRALARGVTAGSTWSSADMVILWLAYL